MKKSKYSDSQIVSILEEAEAGQPVEEIAIPYQSLINLYLRECGAENKKLHMKWSR